MDISLNIVYKKPNISSYACIEIMRWQICTSDGSVMGTVGWQAILCCLARRWYVEDLDGGSEWYSMWEVSLETLAKSKEFNIFHIL